MPKERRNRSASFERRARASPFPCSSSSNHHHRHSSSSSSSSQNPPASPLASAKDIKEWEEVRCPVCMEHPHNAVLLRCSSHDKGCQPFMCDTSYRHSNCLDQYKKAFSPSQLLEENGGHEQLSNLSCPLCRGGVNGWMVVEPARHYMNSKIRSCSSESCGFTGTYGELRKHARTEHPSVRPSKADPERERDWRRMEQQRDLGDLFSTMQSAIGGEDSGLGGFIEEEDEDLRNIFPFPSFTLLFVLRLHGAGGASIGGTSVRYSRGAPRVSSRSRRGRATILWGETFSEPESVGRVSSNSGGGGEEDDGRNDVDGTLDGGSDDIPTSSRRGRGRPRRQLRMSDDDDDDDQLL